MSSRRLTEYIKAEAKSLGFFACGVARADAVDGSVADGVRRWLSDGGNAGMAYMANYTEKRLDPRLLMDGLRSIVSVALNYAPARRMPEGEYQIAAYAYGQDYHEVVKLRLRQLAERIACHPDAKGAACRTFCDTAPILERYWAVKAGLGWTGRNHQLIIPHAGSMFFLGELFLNIDLAYDEPMPNRCGKCHACIDACPTRAIGDGEFRADRCLSYLTIENRGGISRQAAAVMGDTIYGCDRCQQACPWNSFARPSNDPLLQPREELLRMTKNDWLHLTPDDYRRLFKGSAVKRAKYDGLMRNIRAAQQGKDDQ